MMIHTLQLISTDTNGFAVAEIKKAFPVTLGKMT